MARPGIDPAKRAAIIDALREGSGVRSAGSIAREFKVHVSTVSRIATKEGLSDALQRCATKNATRARVADSAERRSQLASDLLDDVEFFRAKFRQEWTKTVVVPGIGSERVEADSAEIATGLQRLMTAVGIAVDKHLAVEKHDTKDDTAGAAVDAWLRNVLGKD